MDKSIRQFGCWPSKVSAELVAGKALRFQTVQALDNTLYWTEQRPLEKGRAALVSSRSGSPPVDVLPAPFSARTKVHEYGGNAFLATANTVYFINGDDQQIWSVKTDTPSAPKQITCAPQWRFADLIFDEPRKRLICVAEHRGRKQTFPDNLLVSVALAPDTVPQITPLIEGDDFYASPRLSPNGQQLGFISWNLPSMPWETAKLQIANLGSHGTVTQLQKPDIFPDGASFQPEWHENGDLWFVNDHTGFGQLYRFDGKNITLFPQDNAESGLPLWVFGMKTYGFLSDGRIASFSLTKGKATLSLLDPLENNRVNFPARKPGEIQICAFEQLVTLDNKIAGILSRSDHPDAITLLSSQTGRTEILKTGSSLELSPQDISIAKKLVFENKLGQMVYGNFYPPTNRNFEGPKNELPPVILTAHGGPTAFSHCGFNPKIQFWTSRGFGYFDVNYSGSWGFGKAYRQRLDGEWGLRDVADMLAAARHLSDAGLADPARLLISGSSAGGYTVLMALVRSNLFAAGASYYGISDLARLCDNTHKFEAGYLENLLGLTPHNRTLVLKARSPLFHAEQITSPMIFFQGMQDKIVPPDQAERMVETLKKQGNSVVYKSFDGEGHGFRGSDTIETALTMEYDFYTDVLALQKTSNS
jgi:dipeptidyl aminopeptidase/acylaminoacyl peptidase